MTLHVSVRHVALTVWLDRKGKKKKIDSVNGHPSAPRRPHDIIGQPLRNPLCSWQDFGVRIVTFVLRDFPHRADRSVGVCNSGSIVIFVFVSCWPAGETGNFLLRSGAPCMRNGPGCSPSAAASCKLLEMIERCLLCARRVHSFLLAFKVLPRL